MERAFISTRTETGNIGNYMHISIMEEGYTKRENPGPVPLPSTLHPQLPVCVLSFDTFPVFNTDVEDIKTGLRGRRLSAPGPLCPA
jgi:hypothetical protein